MMTPERVDQNSGNFQVIREDARYKEGPSPEEFPMFESLKLTIARTLPYWNDVIVPQIKVARYIPLYANPLSVHYTVCLSGI